MRLRNLSRSCGAGPDHTPHQIRVVRVPWSSEPLPSRKDIERLCRRGPCPRTNQSLIRQSALPCRPGWSVGKKLDEFFGETSVGRRALLRRQASWIKLPHIDATMIDFVDRVAEFSHIDKMLFLRRHWPVT